MADRMSWAEYRQAHNITDDEEPAAFAAYLHYFSDDTWNGAAQEADDRGECDVD